MSLRIITLWLVLFSYSILYAQNFDLAGSDEGIYLSSEGREWIWAWKEGEVKKILPLPYGTFFLTTAGIVFSADLSQFEIRNEGLTKKVVKYYRNGEKSFSNLVQDLKDLEADPFNPSNLISCSKDGVFVTTNAGGEWRFLANPSFVPGIKSVAIFSKPDLQILIGHPFKGMYRKNISKGLAWERLNKGLLEGSSGDYEEISDITAQNHNRELSLYAANNFTPIIYQYSPGDNKWMTVLKLNSNFNMIEGLFFKEGKFYFSTLDGLTRWDTKANLSESFDISRIKSKIEGKFNCKINALCSVRNGQEEFNSRGLWMASPAPVKKYYETAAGKRGIYVSAAAVKNKKRLEGVLDLMSDCGLNSMVIDMKDDWGNLRFKPKSDLLKKISRAAGIIDLEQFTPSMKEKNIYLIARLVLFQDRVLYDYNQHQFAVKDRSGRRPWQGIKKNKDKTTGPILEYWVDPFCEKAWEYNVEIAKELIQRGFDEIQFDYVRFPTDGENLGEAYYGYKDQGMDKESAIMSFLIYARENINAPISIDIYGANGWWRTGARTGQDVELFRHYVDAICPMFYPSHFAPEFLNFEPASERTYRIYHTGSLRNFYIGKKSVVIRPYIQAFNLHTAYDRKYYGAQYLANEVKGVEDSIDLGYTFWNMGVKYQLLRQIYSGKGK
jgi:hypothetical protein